MFDYISARTMKSNASLAGQDFPVLGAGAAAPPAPIQRYVCPVFSQICHVYAFFSCGNVYFIFIFNFLLVVMLSCSFILSRSINLFTISDFNTQLSVMFLMPKLKMMLLGFF